MDYPVNLNQDELIQWLDDHYNLTQVTLTPLPPGECAWRYLVGQSDGASFLLKLARENACVDFPTPEVIRAQMVLYHDHDFQQMQPPPRRATTGNYLNDLAGFTAQLLPYMHGETLATPTEPQQREIGLLVARLHRCKFSLRERPPQENFGASVIASLKRILDAIEYPEAFTSPLQTKLLDRLREVRPKLQTKLDHFIQERVELLPPPHNEHGSDRHYVVCHGDLRAPSFVVHDGNLLLTDWEGMSFSPPERDLNLLQRYPKALQAYKTRMESLNITVNPDERLMVFYASLHQMKMLVNYVQRILPDPHSPDGEYDA